MIEISSFNTQEQRKIWLLWKDSALLMILPQQKSEISFLTLFKGLTDGLKEDDEKSKSVEGNGK